MDATRLRHGLTEYIAALKRQLTTMREQRARLEGTWHRTADVYRGEGAEAFAAAFQRSNRMLEQYVETLQVMLPVLEERLRALERFDSPRDPNL